MKSSRSGFGGHVQASQLPHRRPGQQRRQRDQAPLIQRWDHGGGCLAGVPGQDWRVGGVFISPVDDGKRCTTSNDVDLNPAKVVRRSYIKPNTDELVSLPWKFTVGVFSKLTI